jgi:hypothetical protein
MVLGLRCSVTSFLISSKTALLIAKILSACRHQYFPANLPQFPRPGNTILAMDLVNSGFSLTFPHGHDIVWTATGGNNVLGQRLRPKSAKESQKEAPDGEPLDNLYGAELTQSTHSGQLQLGQ